MHCTVPLKGDSITYVERCSPAASHDQYPQAGLIATHISNIFHGFLALLKRNITLLYKNMDVSLGSAATKTTPPIGSPRRAVTF